MSLMTSPARAALHLRRERSQVLISRGAKGRKQTLAQIRIVFRRAGCQAENNSKPQRLRRTGGMDTKAIPIVSRYRSIEQFALTLLRAPDSHTTKSSITDLSLAAVWPEGMIAQPVDYLPSAKWNLLHDTDGVYHILSWRGSRKSQRVRAFLLLPCRM